MSDLSRKLALWAANNPRSEVAPLVIAASAALAAPVSDDDLMRLLLDRPQCCARLRDAAYKKIRELENDA